ncbi:Deoxyribodipyrimidine photo-lyase-related protein [Posidoniimonas polymericola]|uniref:Deoxyribodipyrimidine photo-lyase-related protein n=1 Tax=Posidoniimonas polymericola TaxID=2528002 RepID=A0A5C5YMN6_9BACT|nr:cryptochrome/photolyase family protein [Posidoniimonas polymericola]TWT76125.1 Deoxyribodipyrimidine photo-lyase-related protein [Posidoniimonas polymericola]
MKSKPLRNLVLVLGDQLNADSAAFDGFDRDADGVWMAEVCHESEHVWTHKARIVMFLAAMRHFRNALEDRGLRVLYRELPATGKDSIETFSDALEQTLAELECSKLVVVDPGEWRVRQELKDAAERLGVALEFRADRHFLSTPEQFAEHAEGRKQLRMEYFYREIRRRHNVLMKDGKPVGGKWNFDHDNRKSYGKQGPDPHPPKAFPPDAVTAGVIKLVNRRFAEHPGDMDAFDWPVTPEHAAHALKDFIKNRLPRFGDYQDAMWTGEPFLNHSLLSAAMNLKLINPAQVVQAAVDAYQDGSAPLNCVEGFVRQILGWREYVRGVYWLHMPGYLERNELGADRPLPDFYWTGETEMACLRDAIGQTLTYGYAHHTQRLMVTGLHALLVGVDPREVHKWYLAVYVDAVEWVELPNTLGMSQFADGGVMASKPYAASGKYIDRMSNYCQSCRFAPAKATGDDACPFTTLYWDFLDRNRERLEENQRMKLQVKNLDRKTDEELASIREAAARLR